MSKILQISALQFFFVLSVAGGDPSTMSCDVISRISPDQDRLLFDSHNKTVFSLVYAAFWLVVKLRYCNTAVST